MIRDILYVLNVSKFTTILFIVNANANNRLQITKITKIKF